MKRTTIYRRLLLLAAVPALVLAASCTNDDDGSMPGNGTERTPVRLTAAIQQVATPATVTRTAPGTDALQTVWTKTDYIGLFMLPAGGKIPDDTLPGAHNVPCGVDPATGALTPVAPFVYDPVTGGANPGAPTPMYYPSTDEAVDFVAYYPYCQSLAEDPNGIVLPYMQIAGSVEQNIAERHYAADFLYSDNARGIHRSKDAVALRFRHLMAKLRLDITLGEGFEHGEVTKVTLPGMPWQVRFDMRDGSAHEITLPLQSPPISCLRLPTPAATGATFTFTALVPPHSGANFADRRITVTVDGEDYTGSLPDADAYTANTMYIYPVGVTSGGITISAPNADVPWTDVQALPAGYDLTVANETQLRRFAGLVNSGGTINGKPAAEARVLQTADIELTQGEWTPIGYNKEFLGAYNGDGHTITGLSIKTLPKDDKSHSIYAGLFGCVGRLGRTDSEPVLTGIHLRNVQIDIPASSGETELSVGSIAGSIILSTLSLCSAEGTVKASSDAKSVSAGGIAGLNIQSTISRCRASVKTAAASTMPAEGAAYAGEIAGQNLMYSFILSCEARGGAVTAEASQYARAGGITGFSAYIALIAFCRTGENVVTARNGADVNYAGGLVGNNGGYLYSCYSRATAEATGPTDNRAGAIVGYKSDISDRVQYCYATGATGQGTSPLAAIADNIVYNTSPGPDAIFGVMKGYTGIVESITFEAETVYPTATRHNPAVYPAHGIEPVRVKWGPGINVWQHGTDTRYPEISMEYGGDDNPAAP